MVVAERRQVDEKVQKIIELKKQVEKTYSIRFCLLYCNHNISHRIFLIASILVCAGLFR